MQGLHLHDWRVVGQWSGWGIFMASYRAAVIRGLPGIRPGRHHGVWQTARPSQTSLRFSVLLRCVALCGVLLCSYACAFFGQVFAGAAPLMNLKATNGAQTQTSVCPNPNQTKCSRRKAMGVGAQDNTSSNGSRCHLLHFVALQEGSNLTSQRPWQRRSSWSHQA